MHDRKWRLAVPLNGLVTSVGSALFDEVVLWSCFCAGHRVGPILLHRGLTQKGERKEMSTGWITE
jgi:hypothetical protein